MLLKKNPTAFVQGVKLGRNSFVDLDCLLTSTYEFTDMPREKFKAGFQKRLDLLKSVTEKDLQETKNEMIGIVIGSMNRL